MDCAGVVCIGHRYTAVAAIAEDIAKSLYVLAGALRVAGKDAVR